MKCVLIFFTILVVSGCSLSSKKTLVIVENKSFSMIDSAVLSADSYQCTLYHIPAGATIRKEISRDSMRLNTHDFTLHASLYGGQLPKEGKTAVWYTDLSGSPDELYTITLTGNLTIGLVATY